MANQEWKVYLDSVDQMDFQMARRGWIGDYVDPNNFLDLFLCDGGNNSTGFCDPVYDDLIKRHSAPASHVPARSATRSINEQAETRLMEQMPIIPIYTYTSNHLIHTLA